MFSGANGPLNGAEATRGATAAVGVSANAIGDDSVAGAARVNVLRSDPDVALVNRNALGDCDVDVSVAGSPCGIEEVEAADDVLRDDFLAPSVSPSGAEVGGDGVGVFETPS
jgi:hypothetical protein